MRLIRKGLLGGALVGALALIPSAAHAQAQSVAEPRSVTITPFVGVSFGTPDDLDLGSSLGLGFAVGYDWTRNLGFEFDVGYVFDVAGDAGTAALDARLTPIA